MFSHRRTSWLLMLLLVSGLTFAKPKPAEKPADPSLPPSDAQFTLYCQAIAGPAHIEQANRVKEELIKMTGMKDWYIVHQEGQSVIYYGFYRSIDDPKEKDSARAQTDRKRIDALKDAAGNKVFDRPLFVQVDAPDPAAPPEWNLLNTKGYWSLQIAAYKDSPHRKEAAVEAVRDARQRGVEAYYYHGETTSSVCVGAWPREAVKEQDQETATAADPGQDILVLPQALPAGANVQVHNRDGAPVQAVAPKFDILDPTMSAAKEQYPTHALNGEVHTQLVDDPSSGVKKEVEDPSFFVVIPHKAPSLLRSEPAAPQLVGPATPGTPGEGKLRLARGSITVVRLVIATANPAKAREFREMLGSDRYEWTDLASHRPEFRDVPGVEETGKTFRANACIKAIHYAKELKSWALADDSGLVVDALDGKPGVYSARPAEMNGSGRGDADNNTTLLKQIENVPDEERTARFMCCLALADEQGRIVLTAQDSVEGVMLRSPRGTNGFGYDPLFFFPELGKTTAELEPVQKHAISHRGKALRRLRELMEQSFSRHTSFG